MKYYSLASPLLFLSLPFFCFLNFPTVQGLLLDSSVHCPHAGQVCVATVLVKLGTEHADLLTLCLFQSAQVSSAAPNTHTLMEQKAGSPDWNDPRIIDLWKPRCCLLNVAKASHGQVCRPVLNLTSKLQNPKGAQAITVVAMTLLSLRLEHHSVPECSCVREFMCVCVWVGWGSLFTL